ncbi:MAG: hypothetical protein Q8N56_04605, partial [bacterium]|nr:hypothetical protein [bacterium]
MQYLQNIVYIGEDFIKIDFPPRNVRIRYEFLDQIMKRKPVYENIALKYKDPDETKLYIRNKIREMNFDIVQGELDYWDVQFGKGPMFKQVDSKVVVLSFKGRKIHGLSRILGLIVTGIGGFLGISASLSLSSQAISGIPFRIGTLLLLSPQAISSVPFRIIIGFIIFSCFLSIGRWIGKPLTLWIKGTGVAHRLKGQSIVSDQYFQFSADCGFPGLGKMNILRDN